MSGLSETIWIKQREREIRRIHLDSLWAGVKSPRDLRGRERESSGVKSERSGGSGRGTEGLDIKGKTNTLNLWSIGGCARREMENKAFKAI